MDKYITFFKAHGRLLLVVVACIGLVYGVEKVTGAIASRDALRATAAEQALTAQKAMDAQLAAQTDKLQVQYATIIDTLGKQNAALLNSIQSRQTSLQAQKGSDAHLPVSGLAERLGQLGNSPTGVSSTIDTVILTQPAALAVTQTLEQVPVLQSDLADETGIAQNTQTELDAATRLTVQLGSQVSALNLTVSEGDKARKTELTAVKAQAHKGKVKWFKIGFLTGFVSGLFVGHGAF